MPSIIRITINAAACLFIAIAFSACSENTGKKKSDSDNSHGSKKVKIREVSQAKPSKDLTEALGASGKTLAGAGCSFGTYKLEHAEHVDEGKDLKSKSFPPTSGTHFNNWAPFGFYDKPVDDGFSLHNVEHGGVAVWFGTKVNAEMRDAIAKLLDDNEKWIVSPRNDLEGLFSAAWGVGLSCPPSALQKLTSKELSSALDTWYKVVESTGSDAEKDVPSYAGAMKEPAPKRDISTEAPF